MLYNLFMKSFSLHKFLARMRGKSLYVAYGFLNLEDCETRVATLELTSREIYHSHIEGATAELGVYRGDFAVRINHFFPDRKLYLFDTFEGFGTRHVKADADKVRVFGDFSQTSEELVLSRMEHRENCIIRKGWFPDTAKGIDDKFCFVSLDADLYQPLTSGLEFFYPRLVHGGVIMIHDFNNDNYSGARGAVKDFCDKNNIGYVCLSDLCGSAVITK